ncbi:MAG: hypothetical protein OER04_08440 [Cyclobacteriaceae bacterium]|nr:hypothetical protein [Cyclobacteriaceae bacterium]
MKKYQIITLVILIWTLLVSVNVQNKLEATALATVQQYIGADESGQPPDQDGEPCNSKSISEALEAGGIILLTPLKNILY